MSEKTPTAFETPKVPAYIQWQYDTIETFESLVDRDNFDDMIDRHTKQDVTRVSFDELTVPSAVMPADLTESHYFPGRFKMSGFEAKLTRFPEEGEKDFWQLTVRYDVNGTPYHMFSDEGKTVVKTINYEGAELSYEYGSDLAGKMLAAIAATKLSVEREKIIDHLQGDLSASDRMIENMLQIIGTYDGYYIRDRIVSLPWLDEDRAVVLKYSELEATGSSARRLEYIMSWQLEDNRATRTSVTQSNFATRDSHSRYVAERAPTDIAPDQLLFNTQFGAPDTTVGEMFDAAVSRQHYAAALSTVLPVIDYYLQPENQRTF